MGRRRSERRGWWATPVALALVAWAATGTAASPAAAPPPEVPEVVEAREAFMRANELAKRASWAEALASFERSAALRSHPVTTYNIGACERAMGNYTRARATIAKALAENARGGGAQLAPSLVLEANGLLAEMDALLATAHVTLAPASASVAVDGRPLEVPASGAAVAGTRAPSPGEPAPSGDFRVLLNPGTHVFTFGRKGFSDAVVHKTFAPGATLEVRAELNRLPATLHVESSQEGSLVTVSRVDVGPTPVDVLRPAGSYDVVVRKAGFKPYEAQVVARAGEGIELRAKLQPDRPALTQRWWFWTVAGVVVAGAAVATYALTRTEPTPTRPAPEAGSLNFTLPLR